MNYCAVNCCIFKGLRYFTLRGLLILDIRVAHGISYALKSHLRTRGRRIVRFCVGTARSETWYSVEGMVRNVPAPPRRVVFERINLTVSCSIMRYRDGTCATGRVALLRDREGWGLSSCVRGWLASGRLTRSARRHGDTESGFEICLRTASSTIRPFREGRAPARPGAVRRRLGTRSTRAALGAWRPNGLGPQYHASPGGTRLSCPFTRIAVHPSV